ncbi:MAG: hypothetical protein WBF86_14850, partial [Mycobacterium sp.]
VRRGAGSGRALIGSALAAGSVAGLRPRRVARLPGAGDCSASPDPDALVGFAGPPDFGADTDEVSSSLGAAAAIPAPGADESARPTAKAAAPARAPGRLTDIDHSHGR